MYVFFVLIKYKNIGLNLFFGVKFWVVLVGVFIIVFVWFVWFYVGFGLFVCNFIVGMFLLCG